MLAHPFFRSECNELSPHLVKNELAFAACLYFEIIFWKIKIDQRIENEE